MRVLPKQGDDTFDVPQMALDITRITDWPVRAPRVICLSSTLSSSRSKYTSEDTTAPAYHFIAVIYKFHRTGMLSHWNPHSDAPQEDSRHS